MFYSVRPIIATYPTNTGQNHRHLQGLLLNAYSVSAKEIF